MNIGVKSGDSIPPPATYRQGVFVCLLFCFGVFFFLMIFVWLVGFVFVWLFVDGRA